MALNPELTFEQLDALVERVVERALARLAVRVVPSPQPDLADEIAAYLGEHEGATTTEVVTGVRRQAQKVRTELGANPRFERAPRRAGTNGRAKCWRLAPGRTADELTGMHAARNTSAVPSHVAEPPGANQWAGKLGLLAQPPEPRPPRRDDDRLLDVIEAASLVLPDAEEPVA